MASGLGATVAATAPSFAAEPSFAAWLREFRGQAMRAGVAGTTIDRALGGLSPNEKVVALDRKQSSGRLPFSAYRRRAITRERIETGAARLLRHQALLGRVRDRFGVQPTIVITLWGVETSYGGFTGDFSVLRSLATLAYEGRRQELFERELIAALRIVERGDVSAAGMLGSWAGAMGQCQFMPSTYLDHAVDFDQDGRADIWGSLPDVFASIAAYLAQLGWDGDTLWGREVIVPGELRRRADGLERKLPLRDWRAQGVRRLDGQPLPDATVTASLINTDDGAGPSYLVYENFRRLMVWNRSTNFALGVGVLADAIGQAAVA